MWHEAHIHQMIEEEVEVPHLPIAFDGAVILYLSDTHKRKLKVKDFENLEKKVDWVLIGGDVAEKGISWSIVRHNMQLLSNIASSFTVYGNHDKRAGTAQLARILRESGVQLLQDNVVYLRRGNDRLSLIGIDYRSKQGDMLLEQIDDKYCKIAIVHDPLQALRLEQNADLILSGHTHGGQMVLPFFGPVFLSKAYRPISNGWYSLKRNPEDVYQEGKMLVSRGYGTNHLPLRLGCPAEMHLITLRVPTEKAITEKQP
ncbi:metallophosphoesterase [Paenibacillus xylanexedens]|uniref:metallophosphoesterase n=1 Tax=Paenibacillus xylanexedens TaxID=528191 RepID=UPI001C92E07D|nr:metallophosphoesterase [Paenibacillus xylanexedens]